MIIFRFLMHCILYGLGLPNESPLSHKRECFHSINHYFHISSFLLDPFYRRGRPSLQSPQGWKAYFRSSNRTVLPSEHSGLPTLHQKQVVKLFWLPTRCKSFWRYWDSGKNWELQSSGSVNPDPSSSFFYISPTVVDRSTTEGGKQ